MLCCYDKNCLGRINRVLPSESGVKRHRGTLNHPQSFHIFVRQNSDSSCFPKRSVVSTLLSTVETLFRPDLPSSLATRGHHRRSASLRRLPLFPTSAGRAESIRQRFGLDTVGRTGPGPGESRAFHPLHQKFQRKNKSSSILLLTYVLHVKASLGSTFFHSKDVCMCLFLVLNQL